MRKYIVAVLLIAAALSCLSWTVGSTPKNVMPKDVKDQLYRPLNDLVFEIWSMMDSQAEYSSREQLDKVNAALDHAHRAISRFENGKRMPRSKP